MTIKSDNFKDNFRDGPRVLLLDIEVGPNIAYTWGKWEQNVLSFEKEWELLCCGYRWLGENRTVVLSKLDFGTEKNLLKRIWNLLDVADVVIAHNGDAFDIKKLNAKFIEHNFNPPSPYKTIDTLKIARKYFAFNGNKLGDLGPHLKLGEKLDHIGFKLWLGCLKGDKKSWNTMIRYNRQDVVLLEKVYLKFLPWIRNHPNIGMWDEKTVCPKCGSRHLQSRGYTMNQTTKYRKIQCQNCGGWCRARLNEQEFPVLLNA